MPTLRKFAKEFVETYARTNNKPSEVKSKESTFKCHLLPAFGRMKLDEIVPREIERYKSRKLKEGLSPKSINNHLTILRRSLALAAEWELNENVPRVKWLRVPKPEFDFLTFDEAERLMEAADQEWSTMITVALKTGLRQGEVLGLQWDDVDLKAGRIMVRRSVWRGHIGTPKNGRTLEVPLSPQALRSLKAHRHLRGESVFCREDGSPLSDSQCKWPLWHACQMAGLRRVGWHVMRHSFASHLVMRGVPLKAVQELLGHATMEMTMRYAHLAPEAKRDAVTLLDIPIVQAHGSYTAEETTRSGNYLETH